MNYTYKRGFTLIELLVVIAIIGILASVVLASLNNAREKGSDAAVKADLKGIQAQAAIYYDDNGSSYLNVCTTDTKVMSAFADAKTVVAGTPTAGSFGDGECVDSTTTWTLWVNLKYASTSAFCIDSLGVSKEIPAQDSSLVDLNACP